MSAGFPASSGDLEEQGQILFPGLFEHEVPDRLRRLVKASSVEICSFMYRLHGVLFTFCHTGAMMKKVSNRARPIIT